MKGSWVGEKSGGSNESIEKDERRWRSGQVYSNHGVDLE
jgi:hypothetical protein